MKTYADTSFLVPLFIWETTSQRAIAVANRLDEPLPLVFLNSVEWVNALNARVFRREISLGVRAAAFAKFEEYITDGVFVRRDLDAEALRQQAELLSNRHTPIHGGRSLDLLHVAAAQILDCKNFLTFDDRQHALARAAGLTVRPKRRI